MARCRAVHAAGRPPSRPRPLGGGDRFAQVLQRQRSRDVHLGCVLAQQGRHAWRPADHDDRDGFVPDQGFERLQHARSTCADASVDDDQLWTLRRQHPRRCGRIGEHHHPVAVAAHRLCDQATLLVAVGQNQGHGGLFAAARTAGSRAAAAAHRPAIEATWPRARRCAPASCPVISRKSSAKYAPRTTDAPDPRHTTPQSRACLSHTRAASLRRPTRGVKHDFNGHSISDPAHLRRWL